MSVSRLLGTPQTEEVTPLTQMGLGSHRLAISPKFMNLTYSHTSASPQLRAQSKLDGDLRSRLCPSLSSGRDASQVGTERWLALGAHFPWTRRGGHSSSQRAARVLRPSSVVLDCSPPGSVVEGGDPRLAVTMSSVAARTLSPQRRELENGGTVPASPAPETRQKGKEAGMPKPRLSCCDRRSCASPYSVGVARHT